MKELKEAQMGIITILTVMLVSITRRLPGTRKLSSGITTLALAGIVLLVAAGSASANGVCVGDNFNFSCGDVVNESCKLNASMVCTDNTKPGLYIGADNVVIDGDGFCMTGAKAAAACGVSIVGSPGQTNPSKHSGIYNGYDGTALPASFDNVVIKDLEIEYFCTGIAIGDATFATDIDNMTVTGCYIHDCGESTRITHGIHMTYTSNCNITKNDISYVEGTGSGCSGGGNGIFMYGVDEAGVTRGEYNNFTCNHLHHNNKSGFFMKHQCKHNIISYNNVSDNPQGGIVPKCEKSDYNTYEYNTMLRNTVWGFYTNGNDNTIRYNTIKDTPGIGLELGAKAGETGNNVVTNNYVCNNGQDIVVTLANTGDENTCDGGPTGWCDWSCGNEVAVYYDFDRDGYYSNTTANCTCDNIAGGTCACCNPGLFASAGASQHCAGGFCKYDGNGDDPNDCNNSILGEQKPDYIVTAVDIVWLDDAQYNVTYTVKNDGDEAAATSRTSIATGYSTIKNGTPALGIGESSSGEVGPFACGGPDENLTDSITVCADCDEEIGESNEGNNCGSVPTVTCRWPDYRILDKYETWVDEAAKTYNITYLICNNGTRDGTQNTITKVDTGVTGQPDTNVPPITKGTCIWRVAQHAGSERVYTMSGSYDEITLTANRGSSSPWMTELNQFNNSITNTFYGAVVASLDPCQATICSGSTCRTTVNITLSNIEDYGSGTIHLKYNPSVVEVVDVDSSTDSVVGSWSHWSSGDVAISAYNSIGISGTIVFAKVEFEPKGLPSQCSDLNLTVTTLYDTSYESLPYITSNCEICIYESVDPFITYPNADPVKILNDPGRARVPDTNLTTLRVHVTDDSDVVSVTVNLTPIWGPGPGNDAVPMSIESGGPKNATWRLPNVTAPHDPGVNQSVHCLYVNATDDHGNSETGVCIPLTVLRRGNIVGDTTKTDMGDALYIARYTVGLEPAPDEFVAGIVPAISWDGVNMGDALYIARWTVGLEVEP